MNIDLKCPDRFDIVEEMRQRIAELEAENEKMRTALEDIYNRSACNGPGLAVECGECSWCIASNILADTLPRRKR